MVVEGSIQARWAWAERGRVMATASADQQVSRLSMGLFFSSLESMVSGLNVQLDLAQFAGTGGLVTDLLGYRPAEGQADQFAPTHFPGGLDQQLVVAGHQRGQRRVVIAKAQAMLADWPGRGGQAIDRQLQRAPAAPPPLAHVLQPLLSLTVTQLEVIPDRQVGDVAVGILDPDRH